MRILFLAQRMPYPPDKGDKIRSSFELATLASQHEVDLCCFYDDPSDAQHVGRLHRMCRTVYAEPLWPWQARWKAAVALPAGRPLSLGWFHSPRMQAQVHRLLERWRHDLVFVFGTPMAQYVPPLHRGVVLDMVDVDSEKWRQYGGWLLGLEARRLAAAEVALARRSARVLMSTPVEAATLREQAPDAAIEVWSNAIDLDYWNAEKIVLSAEISRLQPFVVFTGCMQYRPNVDAARWFVTRHLPLLRQRLPAAKFVIVGRHPGRAVRALGAYPGVVITGEVPDVRPYLAGAAAAVAPMRLGRGFPNKVLEALAMQRPVVATRVVADALHADLARSIVVEEGPATAAAALARLLEQPRPLGSWVRDACERHHGAAVVGPQLLELCGAVVAETRSLTAR
jgi:sugar transferase (PEP-CTERM/EpsH1 system associated)